MRKIAAALLLLLAAVAHAGTYTFVSVGTVSSGTGTLNPGLPAGRAAGNLLLVCTAARSGTETISAPAGWTLLYDTTSTANDSASLFGRVATNDANDAFSADWSGANTAYARMAAFSGDVYTTMASIVVHSASVGSTSNIADIPTPALTVTTDNTLIISCGKKNKTATSDGATFTRPSGISNTISTDWSNGTNLGLVFGYTQQTTATNLSASTWDHSVDESLPYGSLTVALQSLDTVPTITDVDTDESITYSQTNVVITGTNFKAAQGDGFVQLRCAGSINVTQTSIDSWADTSIQFDVTQGECKFGTPDIRVQNSDELSDDQAITFTTPSGEWYQDLTTLADLEFDEYGAPTRFYGFPTDITDNDQLHVKRTAGSGNVTLNANASFEAASTVTEVQYRWHNDTSWTSFGTWAVTGIPPVWSGPDVGTPP